MNRALQVIGENAEQIEVDDEGCVCISDNLLSSAGIKDRVSFLGCVRYMKLWDPRVLSKAEADSETKLAPELTALLADNGWWLSKKRLRTIPETCSDETRMTLIRGGD